MKAALKAGLGKNIKQLTKHRTDDKKITVTYSTLGRR